MRALGRETPFWTVWLGKAYPMRLLRAEAWGRAIARTEAGGWTGLSGFKEQQGAPCDWDGHRPGKQEGRKVLGPDLDGPHRHMQDSGAHFEWHEKPPQSSEQCDTT